MSECVARDPGPQPGDIYESYSGGFYEVLERFHRRAGEERVSYCLAKPVYPAGQIFETTVAEFMGSVQISQLAPVPRFVRVYSRPVTHVDMASITMNVADAESIAKNTRAILCHSHQMATALNRIQGLVVRAVALAESNELRAILKQINVLAGASQGERNGKDSHETSVPVEP